MKRTFFLLLAAICICGCAEMEGAFSFLKINRSEAPENGDESVYTVGEMGITQMGGVTAFAIKVLPQSDNQIGKDGGDFVITLSLAEKNPFSLKNEYFEESYNLDADFVTIKDRKQVNDRTVEYTFHFSENTSGSERVVATRVVDTTLTYQNIRGAICGFSIKQTAE